MVRRRFLLGAAAFGGWVLVGRRAVGARARDLPAGSPPAAALGRVALVRATDHAQGVRTALELLELPPWKGRRLFVKPNCNSSDPFPGSTHPEALASLCRTLLAGGAVRLAIGDRSGMGGTRQVLEQNGVVRMAAELGADLDVFDELPAEGWMRRAVQGGHWSRGFALARPAVETDGIVQTCCLKTHRFGGHFTLSLKNSIGLVARHVPGDPHDYMRELHGSPDQRRMIAEVNVAYRPLAVVLDAIEGFADGGPEAGRKIAPGLILASADRVALDAVGVAVLRRHGTTPEVSRGHIFDLEQIARGAELGLGAARPDAISIVTRDRGAREEALRLEELLRS
jgi:uncharacterized protein (DUF362 family)